MKMKQLKLQPRLQKIADMVPPGARLADVGTDHGYLPVWLLQNRKITNAIASDIRLLPLKHARQTAATCGIENGIDFRLCAGLDQVASEEVDTIVVAGMGGEMISGILSSARWTLTGEHTLLLQPMSKPEYLRQWLPEHGYCFVGECLVWDKDTLYPVFQVRGGEASALNAIQAYGGVLLEDDPLYGDYLDRQIFRLGRAAAGLHASGSEADHRQALVLEEIRQALIHRKESLQ
jgi:tRNA (adenine22-N1)-methyltransferase